MNHKPEGLPGLLFFTPKDYERLIRSQNEEKKAEYKAYLQLHNEAQKILRPVQGWLYPKWKE